MEIPAKDWKSQDFYGMMISIYSSIFFSVIFLFLIFHIYLILTNQTTNEFIRRRSEKRLFDQGSRNNIREVC
jgi:hypothetical protein